MKQFLTTFVLILLCAVTSAQEAEIWQYTDARSLTLINKLLPTSNPYFRLDADKYPGMSDGERLQATYSAGLVIAFKTDSPYIGVDVDYLKMGSGDCSPNLAVRGFDLYMRDGTGSWKWAGGGWPTRGQDCKWYRIDLIQDAAPVCHECLLYLPLFSSLKRLKIVTAQGSEIKPMDNPFKNRIAIFGSSYTHGSGASRSAMAYPAQLERMTGLQFINMGFAGNCKLQQYFATALLEADVDAYVFDAFSNPGPKEVEDKLIPFIERFTTEKPGIPLIFVQTVRREKRNFSDTYEAKEALKMSTADSLMREAVAKYKDVYWIDTIDISEGDNECTTDGSHPDSHGYRLWAEFLVAPLNAILSKYGL